jgi:hypothetical protein
MANGGGLAEPRPDVVVELHADPNGSSRFEANQISARGSDITRAKTTESRPV